MRLDLHFKGKTEVRADVRRNRGTPFHIRHPANTLRNYRRGTDDVEGGDSLLGMYSDRRGA